jgi:hypothetical protein
MTCANKLAGALAREAMAQATASLVIDSTSFAIIRGGKQLHA